MTLAAARPAADGTLWTGTERLPTIRKAQCTRVSQQISAAIAGQKSVDAALEQAQKYAEVVGKTYQEK